ncbi:CheR family methyltransferase [Aromatoleum toluclasticum]|uniref:CheR family methyltransferase n=1 Tax=Aromatoleum toluclasticum TaxID=92003 RepID=UPI0003634882|nr:protein-glutamate O-methyltransferase CheR [Aromatoleum toluclasticum]
MSEGAASAILERLSQLLARQLGLNFTPRRSADLLRGMRYAAREFGFEQVDDCIRWLLSAPLSQRQIEVLASHLTVGETYFLRDTRLFDVLEAHVLPELIESRHRSERRLRVWSAACCTGEEAYSLAITLRKALPDQERWHVTVQGSDINPRFLQKARHAVFSEWSFRGTPPNFRMRYCVPAGEGRWQLRAEIREMVDFFPLNLAEDVYPSLLNQTNAVDLILCRNVLIYFTAEQAAQVIRNLAHCLVEGGWLVVGPNELSLVVLSELVPVHFPGVILYRKDSSHSRVAAARSPRAQTPPPMEPNAVPGASAFVAAAPSLPREPMKAAGTEAAAGPYEQARVHYEQGRYAEAAALLAEFESAAAIGTPAAALVLLARIRANQGQLAVALVNCERAIAADKCDPVSHYLRANILQERGAPDEALSAYRRALYLDPEFVLAHFALGNLARSRGESAAANKHFDNALTLARALQPEAHLLEGEGLTAGRLAAIIAALQQAEMTP